MPRIIPPAIESHAARQETIVQDTLGAAPCAALAATLDRPGPPSLGSVLPPLWHWLYFLTPPRQAALGADGHALRPETDLPRRMLAGGELIFHDGLRIGRAATRVSTVESTRETQGRSGRLAFTRLRHLVTAEDGRLAIEEFQDIVYRAAAMPGDLPPEATRAPQEAAWERAWIADEILLFRYSALTFNSHRIHYDRPYAMSKEGYPGLVVHGPLIATLLLELLADAQPDAVIHAFRFRVLRPGFDGEKFVVCGAPAGDGRMIRLWCRDSAGMLTMDASAVIQ